MKLSSLKKYLTSGVINRGIWRPVMVLAAVTLFATSEAVGQEGQARPSAPAAQAAWQRGDYETAYNQFNSLLLLYTRDPLYQYYTGASLVMLERDIERSVTLLASAINSSAIVRSVPDEVWFYYGRALHLHGSFTEAREAYGRYSRQAGRRALPGVTEYISQCNAGIGALADSGQPPVVTEAPAAVTPVEGREAEKAVEPARQAVVRADHQQTATPAVTTTRQRAAVTQGDLQGVPEEHFDRLREAVVKQHEADSLARLADQLEQRSEGAEPGVKEILEQRASEERERAAAREREADRLLTDNKQAMEAAEALEETEALFRVLPGEAYSASRPVPVEPEMPAGLVYTIQIAAFKNAVAPSLFRGLDPVFARRRPGSDVLFYHAGLFRSAEEARNALPQTREAGFPDAFIIAVMDGVQISTERAALLEREWRRVPLQVGDGFSLSEGFSISDQATDTGRPAADQRGSVTGTGVSATEVRGDVTGTGAPATEVRGGVTGTRTPATAVDRSVTMAGREGKEGEPVPVGTLSFRAEAMRVSGRVKPEVAERMELLAGSRGLEMVKNSEGETLFLIGNFITFESADEYVSLLIRNGYSSARVAAYVGAQEIPVEAARELINKLPDE